MFRDVGSDPERSRTDRLIGGPWRSRWRGLRFGSVRGGGAGIPPRSEHVAFVVTPMIVAAVCAAALANDPGRWPLCVAVLVPVVAVSAAALWRPRRRRRRRDDPGGVRPG